MAAMAASCAPDQWQTEAEVDVKHALEEAFKSVGVDLPSVLQAKAVGLFGDVNEGRIAGVLEGWLQCKRRAQRRGSDCDSPSGGGAQFQPSAGNISEGVKALDADEAPPPETSLWDQLALAREQDVSPACLQWSRLEAIHRTEHSESSGRGEEKGGCASPMEVTVNSGGMVYFALFQSGNVSSNSGAEDSSLMTAACLKFAPTRLATQSEKLGSELARHLHVATPQMRVVHSGSPEFRAAEEAAVAAGERWKAAGSEAAQKCCEEFVEALRLSRCFLVMGYVHSRPLFKSPKAFSESFEALKTSTSLGRVLLLDLLLRNSDRLPCRRLGWRGNPGNLLYADRPPLKGSSRQHEGSLLQGTEVEQTGEAEGLSDGVREKERTGCRSPEVGLVGGIVVAIDSGVCRRPPSMQAAQDRNEYAKFAELLLNDPKFAANVLHEISDGNLGKAEVSPKDEGKVLVASLLSAGEERTVDQDSAVRAFQEGFKMAVADLQELQVMFVALKRKLDEMLRAFVAYVIAGEDAEEKSESGSPSEVKGGRRVELPPRSPSSSGPSRVKKKTPEQSESRTGSGSSKSSSSQSGDVRAKGSIRDNWHRSPPRITRLQFEGSADVTGSGVCEDKSRSSQTTVGELNPAYEEKSNLSGLPSGRTEKGNCQGDSQLVAGAVSCGSREARPSSGGEARPGQENGAGGVPACQEAGENVASESVSLQESPSRRTEEGGCAASGSTEDSGQKSSPSREKWYEGVSSLPSRLTMKIRGVNRSVKGDSELREQLEWWNGVIREECHKICNAHNFTTGFLEGGGTHSLVDSYELKVRLEHVLERAALVLEGAATERPSEVLPGIFIGGVVAARSMATLQHIGISKILNLCPLDLVDSSNERDESIFSYLDIPLKDVETEELSIHLDKACAYIDSACETGGKVLIHCFEGRSRSASVVLAYLMLRRGMTFAEAWALLKTAHPRAQPNDCFMRTLVEMDAKLRGVAPTEWKPRRRHPRMCHVCQKEVGFSSDSLSFHVKSKHPGTLPRTDGAPVVVAERLLQQQESSSTPPRRSLPVEQVASAHVSPQDMAKLQLLAVAGIDDQS